MRVRDIRAQARRMGREDAINGRPYKGDEAGGAYFEGYRAGLAVVKSDEVLEGLDLTRFNIAKSLVEHQLEQEPEPAEFPDKSVE